MNDALPYDGAAKEDERCGRHLLAAANRAVSRAITMQAEMDRQVQERHREREEATQLINQYKGEADALRVIEQAAHAQLDRLGVARLPPPFDASISMRIQVLCSMRTRTVPTARLSAAPAVVG